MKVSSLFFIVSAILFVPALLGTAALYLYPLLFACRFPSPERPLAQYTFDAQGQPIPTNHAAIAPFRLLALGDPQLEGDSSLPDPDDPLFPSLGNLAHIRPGDSYASIVENVQDAIRGLIKYDVPTAFKTYRKRLDLLGNDFYLAHIYRTMHWWSRPTHVTVLGDLIGSQWVSDAEFEERGWRFWNRVFRHANKVDESIADSRRVEVLGQDSAWNRRLINPAGNHDIGYAGDITPERVRRFENMYGRLNWDITFRLPSAPSEKNTSSTSSPELRIAIINSMNLDGPTQDEQAQKDTYDYINDLADRLPPVEDTRSALLLLTHIPLYKEDGICVDGPFFTYSDSGIMEQNHLSLESSKMILEGLFGMSGEESAPAGGRGRRGLLINGHDHEGCDTLHTIEHGENATWQARKYDASAAESVLETQLREITARSMMGMYDGYAYLVSAWFDNIKDEWHFESSTCRVGVQHIWWAVHVVDFICTLVFGIAVLCKTGEAALAISTQSTASAAHEKQAIAESSSAGPTKRTRIKSLTAKDGHKE